MGPDDSYLVQYSKQVENFWANGQQLALGACFKRRPGASQDVQLKQMLPQVCMLISTNNTTQRAKCSNGRATGKPSMLTNYILPFLLRKAMAI